MKKAISIDEKLMLIRMAFYTERDSDHNGDVVDVYDSYLVYKVYSETPGYYRVNYSIDGSAVTIAPRAEWQPVEKEWIDRKALENTLVFFGSDVKALGDGKVGGYLVLYGSEKDTDLQGEFFAPDTDFVVPDWDTAKATVYYHHGKDPKLGRRALGTGTLKQADVGVWIEAQLDLRDAYEQAVYQLAEKGKLGWSSGTAGHLMDRQPAGKAMKITRWPLGVDASLTPMPVDHRNTAIPLKSLDISSLLDGIEPGAQPETEQPETLKSVADVVSTHNSIVVTRSNEEAHDMPENQTPPADEGLKALESRLDKLSENVNNILQFIQDEPALRNAGYVTQDGGTADPQVKSFGDFLSAIWRNDTKRLAEVYGSVKGMSPDRAVKDLSTTDGSGGGFNVPAQFSAELLKIAEQSSPILQRVQTIPVGMASGTYPALDQYVTPTAGVGQTAMAAGVKATARAEGAALTETEPTFVELNWRVKEVGGYTEVSNELIRFSPIAVETLLKQLFALAVAAKQEFMILRGNGSTQYLGILNAPCCIAVEPDTAGTFAYADMLEMWSRFKKIGSDPVWLAHGSLIPDIGQFQIGTAGAAVPSAVGTPSMVTTMPGTPYPTLYSEHLPQADNVGCAILADLNAYLVFQNGVLEIAFSEHAAFTANKGTWRFVNYSDGMPWLMNYITLADPQGSYTVSPFVEFDD